MRFLADESCDFAVVSALRNAGHDVVAVSDALPGGTDAAVVQLAATEQRILLTEDKDFGQLVFAAGARSSGVIFFRFPASARSHLASSAVRIVSRLDERLIGKFVVLQPGRVRISATP